MGLPGWGDLTGLQGMLFDFNRCLADALAAVEACMAHMEVSLFGLIGGFLLPFYLILIRPLWGSSEGLGGMDTKKATHLRSLLFCFLDG